MGTNNEAFFVLVGSDEELSNFPIAFFEDCQTLQLYDESEQYLEIFGQDEDSEPSSSRVALQLLSNSARGGCVRVYNERIFDASLSFIKGRDSGFKLLILQVNAKRDWLSFIQVVTKCIEEVKSIAECYAARNLMNRLELDPFDAMFDDKTIQRLRQKEISPTFGDFDNCLIFKR